MPEIHQATVATFRSVEELKFSTTNGTRSHRYKLNKYKFNWEGWKHFYKSVIGAYRNRDAWGVNSF